VSDVIYLYGFVPPGTAAPGPAVHGLDDAEVQLVTVGAVAAVTSALPADRYSGGVIDAHIQDLAWVGERGLAHERVVAWFVEQAEIIPASLFTLYSSLDALHSAVTERADAVAEQLERLAGRREWDLKVGYDRAELELHAGSVSAAVRALDDELATAPPGRRFLLERKREQVMKDELADAARKVAAAFLDELRPHREALVALAPPRGAGELPVLVAAALLVPRSGERELRELVELRAPTLERLGFSVELTGPWAPYRFLEDQRVQSA